MGLIVSAVTMSFGSRKVLNEISAEVDIDKLHSAADPKNRFSGQEKCMKERELRPVQFPVNVFGPLIDLAKPGWMEVAAAGKQQSVIGRQV